MEEIRFNKCQTPLKDLQLEKYPKEVQEPRYYVYRHINPFNNKVYVGITKLSLSDRWNKGKGYKHCKLFYRAIQKYGWDNLQHLVVCSNLDKKTACLVEQHLIKYYKDKNLSYNITNGGEGTVGFSMPEDAKRKIAKYVSDSHKRKVLQYTLDGKFIKEFNSSLDASIALGYGKTSVSNCAGGILRENPLHGYIFIYKDNIETLPFRLKLCEAHRKKYIIVQIENGNVINSFNTIREAEKISGVNRLCISRNIRGLQEKAGKYTWKKIRKEVSYGN